MRHNCGGHIENQGLRFSGPRNGATIGISGETGVGASVGRCISHMPHRVDMMDRYQTCFGAAFSPSPDAPQVKRMPNSESTNTEGSRTFDSSIHRFLSDHLPISCAAFDRNNGAVIDHYIGVLIGNQLTRLYARDVTRKHADTVTVMSCEVSADQVLSDNLRLIVRTASS